MRIALGVLLAFALAGPAQAVTVPDAVRTITRSYERDYGVTPFVYSCEPRSAGRVRCYYLADFGWQMNGLWYARQMDQGAAVVFQGKRRLGIQWYAVVA